MSADSLADLAAKRDLEPRGKSVASATKVLVAAIPSETLAAYTAMVGIMTAAGIEGQYSPFRWAAFGFFVALAFLAPIAVFWGRVGKARGREHRPVPLEEGFVAAFAAAAWGLAMPASPLSTVLKGAALTFATSALVLGGATVLALAVPFLGRANRRNSPERPEKGDIAGRRDVSPSKDGDTPQSALRSSGFRPRNGTSTIPRKSAVHPRGQRVALPGPS